MRRRLRHVSRNASEHLTTIAILAVALIFFILLLSVIRVSIFGHVGEEKHIYFEIVFLLLLAALAEVAVFYLKQQSVIVLMVLGMLISDSFMHVLWAFLPALPLPFQLPLEPPTIIRDQHILTTFAQLGAIILLFKVGLHSKIEHIFSKENLLVAIAGVVLPFGVGYLYAVYSGGDFAYSMFVGAALTATSVGITVAILKEMRVLKERFAQVIIGAAVIDDVLGLLVLALVINLTSKTGSGFDSVLTTFLTAIVFIAGAIITGRYFISYFDRKSMSARRFIMAMALMLFFAYVAEVISLSAIVGAFIAGIILNRSKHYMELEEKTYGLEMLFMPIFFISLGTMVDVSALSVFFFPILLITILAIITKVLGCGLASLTARLSFNEALAVGVGMVPRGEVALIIASLGFSKAILTQPEYSVIASMALLTSFVVPPALAPLIKMASRKVAT